MVTLTPAQKQQPTLTSTLTFPTASYCQKLVTRVSGGAFDQLFPVLEFDTLDDLGKSVSAVEAAPFFAG